MAIERYGLPGLFSENLDDPLHLLALSDQGVPLMNLIAFLFDGIE